MHRSLIALAAALSLVLAGGGCKSNLYRDLGVHFTAKPGDSPAVLATRPFLGVVVRPGAPPARPGIRVERVLRDSPAELAGVRPGDRLVRFGATTLASVDDLTEALRACAKGFVPSAVPDEQRALMKGLLASHIAASSRLEDDGSSQRVEVTLARGDGDERVLPVLLRSQAEYSERADAAIEAAAKRGGSAVWIPFVFDYESMVVDPETWAAYVGCRVKDDVVLYRDVDIIPVIGIFSLVRVERAPAFAATRVQTLMWPLRFSSRTADSSAAAVDPDAMAELEVDATERSLLVY